MATYLSDRVIVYSGTPSVESFATAYVLSALFERSMSLRRAFADRFLARYSPEALLTGMNKFLKSLEITFRRDPTVSPPLAPFPARRSPLASSELPPSYQQAQLAAG
jgi:translation initiation factor RLI1